MPVPKQHFDPGAPDPDESRLKDPFQRIVARQLIRMNTHLWELRNSLGILASWASVQEQTYHDRREREGGRGQ